MYARTYVCAYVNLKFKIHTRMCTQEDKKHYFNETNIIMYGTLHRKVYVSYCSTSNCTIVRNLLYYVPYLTFVIKYAYLLVITRTY